MLGQRRKLFDPLKGPVGRWLGRLGLPPLFFTLLGVLLALAAACLYRVDRPGWAVLVALAAALADFVDGAVARYQNSQSACGDYLDAIADRLVELALLLALARDFAEVVCWTIAAGMLVSYCKPRVALAIATDDHDWPGIGDHADRMLLILVSMALTLVSHQAAAYALFLLASVSAVGALQRILYGCKLIARSSKSH